MLKSSWLLKAGRRSSTSLQTAVWGLGADAGKQEAQRQRRREPPSQVSQVQGQCPVPSLHPLRWPLRAAPALASLAFCPLLSRMHQLLRQRSCHAWRVINLAMQSNGLPGSKPSLP